MMAHIPHTFADFDLEFAPGGKLASLVYAGRDELLSRADYSFDLGAGRFFQPSGWDECFPTIDAFASSPVMGDLVGLAPAVIQSWHSLAHVWTTSRYAARREWRPAGEGLEMRFTVTSAATEPFDFLWASHALFSTDGLLSVRLPDNSLLDDFSLDGACRKFFVPSGDPIRLERAGVTFLLETDQPLWGVWLNRGGWPSSSPQPLSILGLEATNSASEIPSNATLSPGAAFSGLVRLTPELET